MRNKNDERSKRMNNPPTHKHIKVYSIPCNDNVVLKQTAFEFFLSHDCFASSLIYFTIFMTLFSSFYFIRALLSFYSSLSLSLFSLLSFFETWMKQKVNRWKDFIRSLSTVELIICTTSSHELPFVHLHETHWRAKQRLFSVSINVYWHYLTYFP